MSKAEALEQVSDSAWKYAEAKEYLESARAVLYMSICTARAARATQQEIADRTVVHGDDGLARQRIAQIIQEAK